MRKATKSPKVIELFNSLESFFKNKKAYFNLFVKCSFKTEDWIKTEIVRLWHHKYRVFFAGISQKIDRKKGRPDLSVGRKHPPVTIELKVLPTDRNYPTAASRFNANKNNKQDFRRLNRKQRDFIIYIFWKDAAEWKKQCQKLRQRYRKVQELHRFQFNIESGVVIFSLWGKPRSHLRVVKS